MTLLAPRKNLLVKVTVKQAHHGGAWWDPELAVVVRVNDDYSWVTQHEMGSSDGSDDYTASFDYSYHADVPDDIDTVAVRATAWSFNDLRGDDVIEDGTVAYTLNSGLQSYTISGGESWITFDVETVALQKTPTLLITDGNATVEAANGETRMAGPERFVVLTLNVTSASGPFVSGANTVLVPRSLFLESGLWADFHGTAPDYGPLADASYYGEDLTASEVSEDVAGLIAGTVTGAEATAVLDRLLRNATDALVYAAVDVTAYAVLANLPTDVVRILPWSPVSNGPTDAVPQDFWEKIGAAATTAVNVLLVGGQLVLEGLVALAAFLVHLAEAVWDWGMQVKGEVQEAARAAIDKVGEALQAMLDWALALLQALVTDLVWPIVEPFEQTLSAWGNDLADLLALAADEYARLGTLTLESVLMVHEVLFGPLFFTALTVAAAVSIVLTVAMAATLGAGLILALALGVLVSFVVDRLLNSPIRSAEPVPQYSSWMPTEAVVEGAEAYDKARRDASTEDPWAVIALLLGWYLGTKYAFIAAIAAGEPTGNVAGALSVGLVIVGSVVGFVASDFTGAMRIRLGALGLAVSFLGVMFGAVSLSKLNPGPRPVAAVGITYSGVGMLISGWALWES